MDIFKDMEVILEKEIILDMEVNHHTLYCTTIGRRNIYMVNNIIYILTRKEWT